jgi:type 1 glutamine amidotransferase
MKSTLRFTLLAALVAAFTLPVEAADPKKVAVVTVTTGFRHSSIPTAEKILQKLADESKAFTIVEFVRQPTVEIPKKPNKPRDLKEDADDKAREKHASEMKKYEQEMAKWGEAEEEKAKNAQAQWDEQMKKEMAKLSPGNLAKLDGVIFANTTGDLPLPDKDAFIKWIEAGHALMAMHSGSDTFHGYRPFVEALGGEFSGHGDQVGVELLKQDENHPATQGLPSPWSIKQEEMYLFKSYDKKRVRDLWIMDKHPNERTAGHYPVSWVRKAGEGRVFYTSLGHREDVWDDSDEVKDRKNPPEVAKQYQQHILGGIKWALGLAEGSAESQAK